jgi:WD40 repeat protein
LREWLDQSRADIRNQRVLGNAATDWLRADRDPSFLLRGARLDQFAAWVESTDLALTEIEGDYIEACLAERQEREAAEAERQAHEAALERRSRNFLRGLVAVLAVAAVVAIGLSLFAFNQQGIAQTEADQRATAEAVALDERQEALNQADARATQQAIAEAEAQARGVAEEQALEERDKAVEAEQAALVQASIGLGSQAELQAQGRSPETSVLLALEALENYPYTWQAEKALGNSLLKSRLRKVIPSVNTLDSVEWSSDGSQILVSGADYDESGSRENANAWVLDVSTGEELFKITDGEPNMARWSPDESSILALNTQDNIVKVWDVDSNEARFTLDEEDIGGELYAFWRDWEPWSSAGDRFFIYTSGLVKVVDALAGDVLQTLFVPEGYEISQVSWSPSGEQIVVTTNNDSTFVYQTDSGQALYTIPGGFETDPVYFGSWSPSGDRFVTRGEGGAKVYQAATGDLLLDLSSFGFCRYALWSPDGLWILTIDGYKTTTVWDAESGQAVSKNGEMGYLLVVDWSPSGDQYLASGGDGLVHVFDTLTGQEVHTLNGTFAWAYFVQFSPDGSRVVAGAEDNTINIFDLTEASLSISFLTPCPWFSNATWSPDDRQVAFSAGCPPDYPVEIWDSRSGEQLAELSGNEDIVLTIEWSPSGDRILTTYESGSAKIWDAHSFEPLLTIPGKGVEQSYGNAWAAWSPDGSRITYPYSDMTVVIYDSATGEQVLTFTGHTRGEITSGAYWSPDGTRIISSTSSGEALIWDAATGEVLLDLLPEEFDLEVAYSGWMKDGERVVLLTEDGYVYIIDSSSGETISKFFTRLGSTNTNVSFSPAGDRMVIGGYNNVASIWDLATGTEMITYEVGGTVDPVYSPDGTRILIVNGRGDWGRLQIFPVWDSLEWLIDYAKECCVIRELTADEREQFGLPPQEE